MNNSKVECCLVGKEYLQVRFCDHQDLLKKKLNNTWLVPKVPLYIHFILNA